MKITKNNLELQTSWKRAWYGRLLHCFIGSNETLCGKELVPHSYDMHWEHVGYPYCKKCDKKYKEIMAEELK